MTANPNPEKPLSPSSRLHCETGAALVAGGAKIVGAKTNYQPASSVSATEQSETETDETLEEEPTPTPCVPKPTRRRTYSLSHIAVDPPSPPGRRRSALERALLAATETRLPWNLHWVHLSILSIVLISFIWHVLAWARFALMREYYTRSVWPLFRWPAMLVYESYEHAGLWKVVTHDGKRLYTTMDVTVLAILWVLALWLLSMILNGAAWFVGTVVVGVAMGVVSIASMLLKVLWFLFADLCGIDRDVVQQFMEGRKRTPRDENRDRGG
jgi:hypothetical protein